MTGIGLPVQGSRALASVLQMSVSSVLSLSPSPGASLLARPLPLSSQVGPVLSPLWLWLSFLAVELAGKLSPVTSSSTTVSVSQAGATQSLRLWFQETLCRLLVWRLEVRGSLQALTCLPVLALTSPVLGS